MSGKTPLLERDWTMSGWVYIAIIIGIVAFLIVGAFAG